MWNICYQKNEIKYNEKITKSELELNRILGNFISEVKLNEQANLKFQNYYLRI